MFKKLRKALKEASISDRNDFKTALKACFSVIAVASVAAATIMLTATAAPVMPVLGGVAAFAGVYGMISVKAIADTLIEDVKAGKKDVEWETILGQKVKSSLAVQKDLQMAQKSLLKTSGADIYSIISRFQTAADKVTVVTDLKECGNGKFRFAQRKLAV